MEEWKTFFEKMRNSFISNFKRSKLVLKALKLLVPESSGFHDGWIPHKRLKKPVRHRQILICTIIPPIFVSWQNT